MKPSSKYFPLILGMIIGVIYGLITRIFFGTQFTLASVTYLFLIPTILGVIPLVFTDETLLKSYRNIIFIPWICILSFFTMLFLFGLEDMMCLLILSLPFLLFATIGGFLYVWFRNHSKKNKKIILSVTILPLLISPIEDMIRSLPQNFSVLSETVINATPDTVWQQIIQVPEIQAHEYKTGFFHALGIPRPIRAELVSQGKGGIRIGYFEYGLKFIETIENWHPQQSFSLHINVDRESIRNKAFDTHVLAGNNFKFIDATYHIEPLANNKIKLSLLSRYTLTSKVNFYGQLWGNWILKDFQNRLLEVIQSRCEKMR